MVDLIQIPQEVMKGTKPVVQLVPDSWIAGGSIRRWFTGEEQNSDIDIFIKNAEKKIENELITTNKLSKVVMETAKNITFKKDNSTIQIIRMPFTSIADCLDKFDFCLCQFALDTQGFIFSTVKAITTTLNKHLAVNKIQKGFEIDSLRRAFKYQQQGFFPCMGTLKELTTAIQSMSLQDINNQTILSPGGNPKLHFKWD